MGNAQIDTSSLARRRFVSSPASIHRSRNNHRRARLGDLALTAPLERRIMAVVVSAGIVPVDTERVHVATRALRQSQLCTYRMSYVLEIHRLGAVRAGHPLYCLVQDIGNRDGSPIAAAFNLDCPGFDAKEVTDQRTERSHGSTG